MLLLLLLPGAEGLWPCSAGQLEALGNGRCSRGNLAAPVLRGEENRVPLPYFRVPSSSSGQTGKA